MPIERIADGVGVMTVSSKIALLELRRDDILGWLDDEAPYTAADQKHLDQDTPERAYWHHGYQAALADVIELLSRAEQKSGSEGIPK
ncbi:MAG: hypothetical protein ACRD9W_25000 [Terriglobia bacterium]